MHQKNFNLRGQKLSIFSLFEPHWKIDFFSHGFLFQKLDEETFRIESSHLLASYWLDCGLNCQSPIFLANSLWICKFLEWIEQTRSLILMSFWWSLGPVWYQPTILSLALTFLNMAYMISRYSWSKNQTSESLSSSSKGTAKELEMSSWTRNKSNDDQRKSEQFRSWVTPLDCIERNSPHPNFSSSNSFVLIV